MHFTKYLSLILTFVALQSHAAQLTPLQAIKRAINCQTNSTKATNLRYNFLGENQFKVIATGKEDNLNTYYVVTSPKQTMVVSADDVSQPILGILDNPEDSFDDAPPALLDLLQQHSECIANEIRYNAQSNYTKDIYINRAHTRKVINKSKIPALIETKWGQGAPFNDSVPSYKYGCVFSAHCPAGCAPVAFAQLLYYYKAPTYPFGQGGPISFEDTPLIETEGINLDAPYNTFQWDKMLLEYKWLQYNKEQAAAVAHLLKICGLALHTNYTPNGSGTDRSNTLEPLVNNFKYYVLKESQVLNQDMGKLSIDDWNTKIYESLNAGAPVLYMGQTTKDAHEFLVDGYSCEANEDLFHCNFGWNGKCDGEFSLQKFQQIKPEHQYIYHQKAYLKFRPTERLQRKWNNQLILEDKADAPSENIYTTLSGIKISKPSQPGVYIHVTENGSDIIHIK